MKGYIIVCLSGPVCRGGVGVEWVCVTCVDIVRLTKVIDIV